MEALALVFTQGFNAEFIYRVKEIQHFETLVAQGFHLRQMFDGFLIFGRCVVDFLLAFRHTLYIFLQRNQLTLFGAHEQEQVFEFIDGVAARIHAVVNANLEGLAELIPELFIILTLVLELAGKRLEDILFESLTDNLEFTALLQKFTRDIEGQVRRIHQALHKAQVIRQQVLALVHDEHMTGIEL